jgi:uncharacterized protein
MGMDRRYEKLLARHLSRNLQMAHVVGPRQVGKTTSVQLAAGQHAYLTWDRLEDRRLLLAGASAVAQALGVTEPGVSPVHVVFDGIRRYRRWQHLLEAFFADYAEQTRIIVTDVADADFRPHARYRMHPLSVAELIGTQIDVRGPARPVRLPADGLAQLLRFGGFPEPFLRASARFSRHWQKQQHEQLFGSDLRDLVKIQQADQAEILGELLVGQVGQLLNYSQLATQINTSVDTVCRWIDTLATLFHCFTVRPWFENVPKALRKQPKFYLYDWSLVADPGTRRQNFVAAHLLKAVHWWTDVGLGSFELRYLRDKTRRAVDFVVIRDGEPWFLVQMDTGPEIDAGLCYFHRLLATSHAFQVDFELDFVERDCFTIRDPERVSAATLLSQLA